MSMFNHEEAAKARTSLNLSQAKVAEETGINRGYLSQFERGKMVLEEVWLTTLEEYYESQGWERATSSEDSTSNLEMGHGSIVDGFVLIPEYDFEKCENLLHEYYNNRREIENLRAKKLTRGFFGGLDEDEALRKTTRLLVLSARQYEIQEILHGRSSDQYQAVSILDDSTINNAGEYLEALLMSAIPNREKSLESEAAPSEAA